MDKKIFKNTGYLAAASLMVAGVQGCGKYDDGPAFSLRTKKARLIGDWDVTKIGNQNYPSNGFSIEFEFEKDGDLKFTYSYSGYSYTYNGDWEFSSNKEELDLTIDGSKNSFDIKRLTNKEIWMEDVDDSEEWRLEAQ